MLMADPAEDDTRDAMVWASDSLRPELAVELGAQRVISGDTPPGSGGVLRVLLLRVRDPEAEAQMDGLRSTSCPQLLFPGSSGRVHFCSKIVPMGWISATGVIPRVHQRSLTTPLRHLRRLEPSAEVRRYRPLVSYDSSATASEGPCCPSRGRVSDAATSPGELYVGRGAADSKWQPSILCNPFRGGGWLGSASHGAV